MYCSFGCDRNEERDKTRRERCETVRMRDGTTTRFVVGGGQTKMKSTQTEREGKLCFDCLPLTRSSEKVFIDNNARREVR